MIRMAIDASCLINFIVVVEIIDNKNPFICVENKMKGQKLVLGQFWKVDHRLTDVSFRGYKGSFPFNCQMLKTNTAATVSHTQEGAKMIPARRLICQ